MGAVEYLKGKAGLTRMCEQADLSRCLLCNVLRAVESPLRGYNDVQGGFEGLWNILAWGRQRNRQFFSAMIRGLSNPREGLKILTFLFRPRLVCYSLLNLRSL
jgi:hypothetical protein